MFRELLHSEFGPWGGLTDVQLERLDQHYQLLVSWNRRLNLTRIQDELDVVRFHYCESLYVSTALPSDPVKVCDLGSGAGFPGIPLAVSRPDVEVSLIEADQRKAVFLREAARDLKNVRVLATRHQDCKMSFDWMVSRAVALDELLASKLAPNFALLLSAADAPLGTEVIRLPWGRDRALAVSRETGVPRGT
jgi:16S rRNA (guanine527-N7)-methyltransferase